MTGISNLLKELRRRNVFKVGVAYGIVAWLLIQIIVAVESPLHLPDWVDTLVIIFLIAGFPIALLFAWAFELTPEGVKRTQDTVPTASTGNMNGRKFDFIIIGLLLIIVLVLIFENYISHDTVNPKTEVVTSIPENVEAAESRAIASQKSVAVLPFANRSKSVDDAYFADGLHDDLLTHLSKITDMKVISRTSVMGYRNTTKNMKTIGGELGVATLLEGSVQRAANQVRINVQLIDVNTDEHLWAEIYDRELTTANIFAIQSEIATAIARALRATLSAEEQERLAAVPTDNLAAYEAYLLGKQRMVTRSSKYLAEAAAYFNQAIALDPTFALAYVGLADVTQLQFLYAGLALDEMKTKAEFAIDKALKLDDKSGEAYASMGLLKLETNDIEGAKIAFQRALALNPNYATAHQWYASLLSDLGRMKEASAHMQKALVLDPLSIVINTNVAFYHSLYGRFDQAMAQYNKIIEIDPATVQGYIGKARLYWAVHGRLDEAYPWFRKAVALDPNSPQYNAIFGGLYLTLGDDNSAECWLRRAIKLGPESILPNLLMAYLHAVRNEYEKGKPNIQTVLKINPDNRDALILLRDQELNADRYDRARAVYKSDAKLLDEDDPVINRTNFRKAVDLAYVLQLIGEQKQADMLLDRSLVFISNIPRLDFDGYKLEDVRIYALRGHKQQALTALRQAIDEGWRDGWWYYMEIDPALDTIRTEPEFQSMLEEIKSDMARQLARVKEMEKEGDVCVNP